MKTMGALLVTLMLSSCATAPRLVGATNRPGHVGPVPVDQLVHALLKGRDRGAPIRRPPIVLAISPLMKPSRPAWLVCDWKDGKVASYRYSPPPKWNPADPFTAIYEHVRVPDPEVDQFDIMEDLDRVEQVLFFDEKLVSRPGSVLEIADPIRTPAYHVAYLCSEGSRVAIMLGYSCGGLCGSGHLIILENSGGQWRFVSAVRTWIS